MSDQKQCPACQSAKIKTASGQFASSPSQAVNNLQCEACGTAWRPACSRGLAIFIIIAGIVLPGGVIAIEAAIGRGFADVAASTGKPTEGSNSGTWVIVVICVAAMIRCVYYGVKVLRGEAGQLKILGKVSVVKQA